MSLLHENGKVSHLHPRERKGIFETVKNFANIVFQSVIDARIIFPKY